MLTDNDGRTTDAWLYYKREILGQASAYTTLTNNTYWDTTEITGPREWLSFGRATSNDSDSEKWGDTRVPGDNTTRVGFIKATGRFDLPTAAPLKSVIRCLSTFEYSYTWEDPYITVDTTREKTTPPRP